MGLAEKLAPFEKFRSSRKEEARTEERNFEYGQRATKRSLANHIAWINLF